MRFYQVVQTFSRLAVNKTQIPDKRAFAKKKGEAVRLGRLWNGGARLVRPVKTDTPIVRVSKDGLIRVQSHSMRGGEVVAFINSLVDPTFSAHSIPPRKKRKAKKSKRRIPHGAGAGAWSGRGGPKLSHKKLKVFAKAKKRFVKHSDLGIISDAITGKSKGRKASKKKHK
jgi:hypothetical protein